MDWHMSMEGAHDGREEERSREFRYTLAGQISTTPASAAAGAENGLLDDSVYSDVDYRRALGPKADPPAEGSYTQQPAKVAATASSFAGWTLLSLQTIGDMVGKVWEFCKTGAVFKGFRGGGGQAYDANGATVTETTGEPWAPESDPPLHPPGDYPITDQEAPAYTAQQAQTPYSPDLYDASSPDSTPQPAAKRRQVSANNDELRNWVVVDEPSNQQPKTFAAEVKAAAAARPSGLARPRSGYYSQTSASSHRRISVPSQRFTGGVSASRPSLRISHAGSPSLTPREPASFASPRSSPVSHPSPSRIPVPVQPSAQYTHNQNLFAIPGTTTTSTTSGLRTSASRHPAGRPSHGLSTRRPISPSKLHHRRNQSTASSSSTAAATAAATTSSSSSSSFAPTHARRKSALAAAAASPRLDAEARQLAKQRLAAERDADARVDAFNARLLSMIRQGREALGTKVEVEMVDEFGAAGGGGGFGGGWEDDD
jgi:hypothetical protein